MFRVGQKVVCVDCKDERFRKSPTEYKLLKGRVYTIRDIDTRCLAIHHGVATVRLEEVVRPITLRTLNGRVIEWEAGYVAHAFRPVRETKTDISIFMKMLTPNKERAPSNGS